MFAPRPGWLGRGVLVPASPVQDLLASRSGWCLFQDFFSCAFNPMNSSRSLRGVGQPWRTRVFCSVPLLLACLMLFFGPGCGGGGKGPSNVVTGKITLNGQPVMGTVVFIGPDNKEVLGGVSAGTGEYRVDNPATGLNKILVRGLGGAGAPGPAGKPMVAPGGKDPANMVGGQGVPPPAKYGSVKTSDLTFNVTGGQETHDITLKP